MKSYYLLLTFTFFIINISYGQHLAQKWELTGVKTDSAVFNRMNTQEKESFELRSQLAVARFKLTLDLKSDGTCEINMNVIDMNEGNKKIRGMWQYEKISKRLILPSGIREKQGEMISLSVISQTKNNLILQPIKDNEMSIQLIFSKM